MAAAQFQEIVGLQDHVVEFEEAQRLLPLQAQLHRFVSQHPVDGKMPAVITQERDVIEIIQPVGVVDHDGVGRAIAKGQKLGEHVLDPRHVGGDVVIAEKLAGFVLARRVADFGGAAAHQHDGFVPGLLKQPEQHNRHQRSGMQARRGAIEPNVSGEGGFVLSLVKG